MLGFMKEISARAKLISGDDKESYAEVDNRLQKYLEGENDLSYQYFANSKVGYRTVSQDIIDVLESKSNKIPYYIDRFFKEQSAEKFKDLINAYYIEALAVFSAHEKNKELQARLDTNISSLGLFALTFLSQDDQERIRSYLHGFLLNRIKSAEEKSHPPIKRCYGAHSVLPLYILLSEKINSINCSFDFLGELIDKDLKPLSQKVEENFNEIYSLAFNEFLSDDRDKVTEVFRDLGDYHLERCRKDAKEFYDFDSIEWQFMPSEMLALLRIRVMHDKSIDFISHPVIDHFMPLMIMSHNDFISDENKLIKNNLLSR